MRRVSKILTSGQPQAVDPGTSSNSQNLLKSRAEAALGPLENAVREAPEAPSYHARLGLVYAYLGRNADALREGSQAVNLLPVSTDAFEGPGYVTNLAEIFCILGE